MSFFKMLNELIFQYSQIFVLIGFCLFIIGLGYFLRQAFFIDINKEDKDSTTYYALLCIIGLLTIIAFTFGGINSIG